MTKVDRWLRENAFLKMHVYIGLQNLNDGFDVPDRAYFSEAEFTLVLERCKTIGIIVDSIEPWKNKQFFAEVSWSNYSNQVSDVHWYINAFENFVTMGEDLIYSASLTVPMKFLEADDEPNDWEYVFMNALRGA